MHQYFILASIYMLAFSCPTPVNACLDLQNKQKCDIIVRLRTNDYQEGVKSMKKTYVRYQAEFQQTANKKMAEKVRYQKNKGKKKK